MIAPGIGTVLSLPGSVYAELLARHLDFVWIDLEHAALGATEMQDAIVGIQAAGAEAFVRVPPGAPLAPCLDAGADGIVLPRVRSVIEAEAATRSMRHAPEGTRGYGPRRLALWPRTDRPACVAQIEDLAGVHASRDIAAVKGVDALVVGAVDLSFELGEPLVFDTPPFASAVATVRRAAGRSGARFGVAGAPLELALDAGAELIVHQSDIRIIDAALELAAAGAREAQRG
jgi:2-keto-3-deoxy-L-rhamnonate aldolase RhmA